MLSAKHTMPNFDDPEKKANVYLELYKQQMAYFHETRRIEFQANLALWGAILALGYAAAGRVQPSLWVSLWFVLGTTILSGIWAFFLQKTKNFDKTLFSAYRGKIEALLGAQPTVVTASSGFVARHAWFLFFVIATLLLSVAVMAFLRMVPIRTGTGG